MLRSLTALAVLLLVAALVAQIAGVTGQGERAATTLDFGDETNQWLVQLPNGVQASGQARSLGRAADGLGGGKSSGELPGGWYEVRLRDDVSTAEAEGAFGEIGAVDVEPVMARLPYDNLEPDAVDDPVSVFTNASFADGWSTGVKPKRIGEQWALDQAGTFDIDAPQAWQKSTGASAVVAVIDTGVDAAHPDLAGRVLAGRDFSGSGSSATTDVVGHGTKVAGVIAARGIEIAGVAPDAKILPLKVYRDDASSFSMSGYLNAIRYAVDQKVDAINISLGCGGSTACYSQAELDAIRYANTRGVPVVVAAGNGDSAGQSLDNDDPETPDYPSGYDLPNIISVTSINKNGKLSRWANYGAVSVDLGAPGENVLTTRSGGGYIYETGTSFSAPYVAGAVALMRAMDPGLTGDDIRARINDSSTRISGLAARSASGGTLNANRSLQSVSGGGKVSANATTLKQVAPRNRARVASRPTLAWKMPKNWSSTRVEVRGSSGTKRISVGKRARAVAHPISEWKSGTYRWRVVGKRNNGRAVTTNWQTYTVQPQLGAWVTSGRVAKSGRAMRLRVGYAANLTNASTKITIRQGNRVLHKGKSVRRKNHVTNARARAASPPRGWFSYEAPLSGSVPARSKIIVEVEVRAGGKTLRRKFAATAS